MTLVRKPTRTGPTGRVPWPTWPSYAESSSFPGQLTDPRLYQSSAPGGGGSGSGFKAASCWALGG